jgi:hypothetical protein
MVTSVQAVTFPGMSEPRTLPVGRAVNATGHPIIRAIAANPALQMTSDHRAAVEAFLEKRKPVFKGV